MKFTDLEPRWFTVDGVRVGFTFDCPCCRGTSRETRLAIATHHRGHEAEEDQTIHLKLPGEKIWTIDWDDFGSMTVAPSVDASAHGHWHGVIENGLTR